MMHTCYALMGGLVVQSADGTRYGFTWIDLRWLWQNNVIDLSGMERKDIKIEVRRMLWQSALPVRKLLGF